MYVFWPERYHGDKHFSEFYLQDGGKNQLVYEIRTYGTKLRHCHRMYVKTNCLPETVGLHDKDVSAANGDFFSCSFVIFY